MKIPYQITGLLSVLLAVYVASEALRLGIRSALGPGPGFSTLLISALMGLAGCVILWQATFQQSDPRPADFFPAADGYRRMGAILFALVGVVVLMDPLGFRLTMLAFLAFTIPALGKQNPIVTGLVAVTGSFGVYHAFVNWLMISLPIGVLGF